MSTTEQKAEESEIRRIERDLFKRRAKLRSLLELDGVSPIAGDLESWQALISEIGTLSCGGNPVDDVAVERR